MIPIKPDRKDTYMKRISVNIFILILTLAALTACSPATAANTSAGNDNGQAALVTKMSDGEETESAASTAGESNDGFGVPIQVVSDNSFSLTPCIGSGTLACTVEKAYLVDNIFDEGIPLDEIDPDSYVEIGRGEKAEFYDNPDFVDAETGQVVDGAYIVAVEMTVTNVDASTEHYMDNRTLPLGSTPSPASSEKAYVFRADFLYLYDRSRAGEDTFLNSSFVWFTGYGQRDEAPGAFYLPVGETATITIYYIVGEYDGSTLSSLGLSNDFAPIGKLPDTLYPLPLDIP